MKNLMLKKRLFNPEGIDTLPERKMIEGNSTNIFNLNNVKYNWATKLYRIMMENFWIPEKVDLNTDLVDYDKLTDDERRAYDGIFSFLVFLDSIQTNNLPKISEYITSPEVNLVLSIQTYQEAIHSQSYAYAIESIIPVERRDEIYEFWRDDNILFDRISFIAKIYQDFHDNSSKENFLKVLIANYLLEAVYFYNGFNFFYLLTSRNLMSGTADIIKYINRDELTHVILFERIINSIKQENSDIFDEEIIYSMFETAVEQEISWTNHIIGDNILGVTLESTEQYTKYIANKRLKSLGLKELYNGFNKNPYLHLETIADTNGGGDVKANFFESTVTSYNQSSVIDGWDEI